MKLIEAMKQVKDLMRKASDLKLKVSTHSAISSLETPEYPDQKEQVAQWVQAHSDILKEILRLRIAIQRTNLATIVPIEIAGRTVTKTLAEWIHRRRDLAKEELSMWQGLTDKKMREGVTEGPGGTKVEIKIVRFYDPKTRDTKMDEYSSEPSVIDAKLEISNAVTDLIEE